LVPLLLLFFFELDDDDNDDDSFRFASGPPASGDLFRSSLGLAYFRCFFFGVPPLPALRFAGPTMKLDVRRGTQQDRGDGNGDCRKANVLVSSDNDSHRTRCSDDRPLFCLLLPVLKDIFVFDRFLLVLTLD
jgi:hypothetical protein